MVNRTQETYNQFVMQQNFNYSGFPTQVNNVESTEASKPYLMQQNYPRSVHPTQVNNIDPSYMYVPGAQSGEHTHNPHTVQENHPHSMLPWQINNTGGPDFRNHNVQSGIAQQPNSTNPHQGFPRPNASSTEVRTSAAHHTSVGQRGTRPVTAAELLPVLRRFKNEKETAERHCNNLQAHCSTLQAEKDSYEKQRNSLIASHNAISIQAQRIDMYRQNLQQDKAALQKENQLNVERLNALQATNVQIQREREHYMKVATHLLHVIAKAQKEQRPPSDPYVQQFLSRGQAQAMPGRRDPANQAQSQVQSTPMRGRSEHPQNEARKVGALPTPPMSVRDTPTPPIADAKATNPFATSKEVIDLSDDGGRGIKRKSPDGGWDITLRTPAKRVWEQVGKQKFDEKAQKEETHTIKKGYAECKEARTKAVKKTSQTIKKPRVPARKKSMAAKPAEKQPEQADPTAEHEDLISLEKELEAILDADAAAEQAELGGELVSKTVTPLAPKEQSASIVNPGVEANAAALEESFMAVNAPVDKIMPASPTMSLFGDGELQSIDDLFNEMEAHSVQQE